MRISERVEMLEVKSENGITYPVLLWDDTDVVLIDTVFPMQMDLIRAKIEEAGFSVNKITKIIFTHQDMDHIGCIKEFITESPNISILAHEAEAPYIQGDKTPVKLAKMESSLETADEATKKWYTQFKSAYESRYTKITHLLKDGESLPICGGIEIIHTPGHTPGHICLYLTDSKILITGDALNINDGKLTGPNPQYTLDMQQAQESIKKLLNKEINQIASFHGGLYSGNANDALSNLI